MILTGQLLLCDQPKVARLAPGIVRVSDGHIVEVIEGEISGSADIGSASTLICPGFIDTHLHLPQFDMIGAHGMPLLDWLSDVTFPSERKWADADYARAMATRVFRQCLSVGTTAICAYGTVHHDGTMSALEVASNMGMRGVIGQVLMDRNAPDYLIRDADQLLDEASQTLGKFPVTGRMAAAVTPRFAVSCTEQLLEGAGKLASEYDAIVQTHLAETVRECELVEELFDGTRYIDVYRHAGLLTARTLFGHGIHLNEADRDSLRAAEAIVAHCPTANSFLRSGTMNRHVLVSDNVPVSLGSDVGAGYERSMVRVARAMIEAASAIGDDYPSAAEAWFQMTAGNADALGWSDAGRIAVDHYADLVVIQPDIPWLDEPVDPLARLMFAWDDRWIEETLLRGTGTQR